MDLVKRQETLPAKIEEIIRFVKMGKERHIARLAEIRAITDIPEAQEIKDRLMEQTIIELEETWKAHGQLGKLIETEVGGKGNYKSVNYYTLDKFNLDKNDSRFARGIKEAIESGISNKLVEQMIKNKTILRYSALYNNWKKAQPKPETPSLPEGRYSVIHADPPWPVSQSDWDKWELSIDAHYKTMSLEAIKEIDIQDKAAENCSLFLWTTHTFLEKAFEVIKAWGFKYHCCVTWDKGGGWTLFGFHRRTEFCLYAYKGQIEINPAGDAFPTLLIEKKTKHSRKPEKIYELIELKTEGGRLDLWPGDYNRKGWETWGKEHG